MGEAKRKGRGPGMRVLPTPGTTDEAPRVEPGPGLRLRIREIRFMAEIVTENAAGKIVGSGSVGAEGTGPDGKPTMVPFVMTEAEIPEALYEFLRKAKLKV